MQNVNRTYQLQTNEAPQLNLQSLPQVGLIRKDSVPGIQITRRQFDLIEIDTVIPERFRQPLVRIQETPQVLTSTDSLRLNLKGPHQAFTNWNLTLDELSTEFNETAYAWFDSVTIAAANPFRTDSLYSDSTLIGTGVSADSTRSETRTLTTETRPQQPELLSSTKPDLQADWFLALLTLSVLIAGFTRLNWGRYLTNTIQSVFYQNAMGKLEGSNASNNFPSFIMGFLFLMNSSLFVYEILKISRRSFLGFDSFLILPIVFVFLFLLFYLKKVTYRLVGHIFETQTQVAEYLFGSSTISKAYGILLLPVITFLPFVSESLQPILVKAGLGLFILLYLIQLGRGVRIIFSHTFSVYYIILYLCALEILPLTILFKVIFR